MPLTEICWLSSWRSATLRRHATFPAGSQLCEILYAPKIFPFELFGQWISDLEKWRDKILCTLTLPSLSFWALSSRQMWLVRQWARAEHGGEGLCVFPDKRFEVFFDKKNNPAGEILCIFYLRFQVCFGGKCFLMVLSCWHFGILTVVKVMTPCGEQQGPHLLSSSLSSSAIPVHLHCYRLWRSLWCPSPLTQG